ncbi:MAG: ABC transporter substrate-binding protein [Planctomycetes bacterium]|nr:ABC transporter substrate-binding protein [Planctomycetota bacterium]
MPRPVPSPLPLAFLLVAACGYRGADPVGPELARPPVRIVAGSVLAAEVLLEIAPRERIAAVHYLVADPSYSLVADTAAALPLVGAEPEQLLSVGPDLVIVDAFTKPETLAVLAMAGVPVLRTTAPKGFADIAANIGRIGRVCRLEAEADALVTAMRARLDQLAARDPRISGQRPLSLDGGMHTYGRGSLFDAVISAAGARNLSAERGAGPFRIMNIEGVLAWRPETLVIVTGKDGEAGEREWIAQSPGFEFLPAVIHDRILFVPSGLFGTTSHRIVDLVAFVQDGLLQQGPR